MVNERGEGEGEGGVCVWKPGWGKASSRCRREELDEGLVEEQ